MSQPFFVLTLDIGTSSTRAMLFDTNARPVPGIEAQFQYEMRTTPDGGVETDADEMLACAERAIDHVLAQTGHRSIVAVGSDSLVSNVLGVDAHGRAVTPVFTYADTRNAREVNELRTRLDERTTHQRVGTLFHSSYLPARFLWFARARADEFTHVKYWMSLGEYFLYRWTGERACSYSVASWTGLLNRTTLDWDDELIHQIPISKSQLSPLVDHDHNVGSLNREYTKRWAALHEAKFFPTIGDGATANLGSGCVDTSRIALTIGTSSAMRVTYPRGTSSIPWGLWSYSISRDLELLGGALSEGGNWFAWMDETLQLGQEIERHLETMQPDAHGLTVLPFLAGERAPNWNANARAAIIGLSLSTRPIDILRAGLEAIAYRLGLIFQLVRGVVPSASTVIASGGALMHSPTWIQIIADTLGVPVIASAEPEATSRGTALLALKALGLIQTLNNLPAQTGAVFTPNLAHHEIYARAIERQQWLYNQVVREDTGRRTNDI